MATYQTFKETADQDILIEDGDLVIIEDTECVRQQLETNFRLSKNDWFLDLNEGLNYYDNENGIFGARTLSEENKADLIETGATSPGIRELNSIEFNIDDGTLTIPIVLTTEFSEEPEQVTVII